MGKGKPAGIRAGRKLRIHRRNERWASKVSGPCSRVLLQSYWLLMCWVSSAVPATAYVDSTLYFVRTYMA